MVIDIRCIKVHPPPPPQTTHTRGTTAVFALNSTVYTFKASGTQTDHNDDE